MFFIFLAIGIALLIYNRRKVPVFRRLLGNQDIREGSALRDPGQMAVNVLARMGSETRAEQHGNVLVFETTQAVRVLVAALLGVLVLLLLQQQVNAMGLVFLAIAGYWIYYVCVFRVVIEDSQLHTIDWMLRHQTYDLALLRSVEEDSTGNYRLEFSDGRVAYVIKYLTGHSQLHDLLLATLRINRVP
ncbi:MAG: hypothetical protein QNJ09_07435 [Paracoccaceae bacterium]|nr:hypothetical protein [Paracoccaceae bacterium]